ncbi:MAG: hypothetical protein QM537_06170 [Candidatus Symbiobacter sp.]|nr:hypothetical protein [Candidatus Symbiobacter sp.]
MQFWQVLIKPVLVLLFLTGSLYFSPSGAAVGDNAPEALPSTTTPAPASPPQLEKTDRTPVAKTAPKPALEPAPKPAQNLSQKNPATFATKNAKSEKTAKTDAVALVETPAKPVDLPKVAVRIYSHQTYVRVIFDWDSPTSYNLFQNNGIARIEFSRPGAIDVASVYKLLPKSIGAFESEILNGVLQTAFTFPKNVRLRDAMIGHLLVIDILAPPDFVAVHPPGRLLPPPARNDTGNAGVAAAYAPANVPPPGETMPAANAPMPTNQSAPSGLAGGNNGSAWQPGSTNYDLMPETNLGVNCAVSRDPVPSRPWRFNCSSPVGAALFQREGSLYVVFDHKINFDLSQAEIAANNDPINDQPTGKKGKNNAMNQADSSYGYPGKGGKTSGAMGFPDRQSVVNAPNDPRSVTGSSAADSDLGFKPSEYEELAVANGSAVRLGLPPLPPKATARAGSPMKWVGRIAKLNPSIDPNRPNIAKNGLAGSVWVVGAVLAEPTASVVPDYPIENATDPNLKGKKYLRIPLADAEQVIPLRFSEYDRPLMVIPTKMAGRGVAQLRKFMQFSLLPSQQGLLIQLESDGVNVAVEKGAVLIGGEVPVVLSQQLPPPRSVYDFSRWENLRDKYDEVRQRLQRVAAQSDATERDAARFDLAQFFIAYGHAADAVGWLDLLQARQDDGVGTPLPIAQQSPSLLALRGAALVLNGQNEQGLRDLSDRRLDSLPQIGLWRGLGLAASEKWAAADAAFRAGGNVPPVTWPVKIRAEMVLEAANTAWHLGNKERVKTLLIDYPNGNSSPNQTNRANYLRAQLRLTTGDLFDEKIALGILDDMIAHGDAWARNHGRWLRLQIELKHDSVPLEEATATLEHLRYAWPGGELEYEILKQLGDLYFKLSKPREGLKSMREAATWFPNRPDHPAMRAHLIDRFVELYTDPDLASIPTLSALAVYDENRDLTPRDARGDLMIQHLANRLVKIDLLDRAAELLNYQIQVRLSGREKSRVGADLAAIQLLDRKPDKALTALNASETANIPSELANYRKLLRARALFMANRSDDALKTIGLLTGNNSLMGKDNSDDKNSLTDKDSELLRAEIFIAKQEWRNAAEVFGRLANVPDRVSGRKLDETRQNYVVNLAAALVMAGDNVSLQRLGNDFTPIFPDGLQKQAFLMLTNGSNTPNGANLAALMAKFSDLQQFRASLEAFTNANPAGNNDDATTTRLAKKP